MILTCNWAQTLIKHNRNQTKVERKYVTLIMIKYTISYRVVTHNIAPRTKDGHHLWWAYTYFGVKQLSLARHFLVFLGLWIRDLALDLIPSSMHWLSKLSHGLRANARSSVRIPGKAKIVPSQKESFYPKVCVGEPQAASDVPIHMGPHNSGPHN